MAHRKAVFTAQQLNRARHLLDMLYRPSELAEELGVSVDMIWRSCLPEGCPHDRDETGHIWINGVAFYRWAQARGGRKRIKMADGQAFCFRCRQPVAMVDAEAVLVTTPHLEVVTGRCPACGAKISRGRARRDQP